MHTHKNAGEIGRAHYQNLNKNQNMPLFDRNTCLQKPG